MAYLQMMKNSPSVEILKKRLAISLESYKISCLRRDLSFQLCYSVSVILFIMKFICRHLVLTTLGRLFLTVLSEESIPTSKSSKHEERIKGQNWDSSLINSFTFSQYRLSYKTRYTVIQSFSMKT